MPGPGLPCAGPSTRGRRGYRHVTSRSAIGATGCVDPAKVPPAQRMVAACATAGVAARTGRRGSQGGAVDERTAMLSSGIALPYAETGCPGRSVPVVLVHGYVESWRYFEHVLHSLPESVHAFAPTQRGHRSVE